MAFAAAQHSSLSSRVPECSTFAGVISPASLSLVPEVAGSQYPPVEDLRAKMITIGRFIYNWDNLSNIVTKIDDLLLSSGCGSIVYQYVVSPCLPITDISRAPSELPVV